MPKHRFVSAVSDGGNSALVRPQSNWNDAHVVGNATKSSSYNLATSDDYLIATATLTFTMPSPSAASGQPFTLYHGISGGGTVTINPNSSEVFKSLNNTGAGNITLVNFGQYVEVWSDGTNWWIKGSN